MTKEEVFEIAKFAGFTINGGRIESPYIGGSDLGCLLMMVISTAAANERKKLLAENSYLGEQLQAYILAEREACAKVCDEIADRAMKKGYTVKGETFIDGFGDGAGSCAAEIRTRGEE